MGKGGGGKMRVADYRMSLHYRLAHGLDALLAIYVGEKIAWSGEVTTETQISINRPDLFGGNKKEGGTVGVAHYLPGGPAQVMPGYLAQRLGLTSATCPAYRNMASIFFTGGSGSTNWWGGSSHLGFLWSQNNPYLKPIWVKGRRKAPVLNQAIALIGPDSNPAHQIYECLIDQDWGLCGSPSGVDIDSFNYAAQVLYDEQLGLSMLWSRQTTIEAFVSEIQDHIKAAVFVNPRNGLYTIKLFRDDYNIEDLPILTPDNCKITSFDRKAWGETVNEIVVTWTNPENEQEETVAAQNNANIAIQGGIVSDSRNYYGVRNVELAQRLAHRDLVESSAPLATFDIEVDRSAWDLTPGSCVRLQYPEYDLDDVIVRITNIDYGKPGAPSIKISALEDIFSLMRADFEDSDDSQWEDTSEDPDAPAYARVITAPAYFTARALSAAEIEVLEEPEVLAAPLVSQTGLDTYAYNLYGQETQPNGEIVADLIVSKPTLGHGDLLVPLAAEAQSLVVDFGTIQGGPGPRPGGFAVIGNVSERGQEIALLDSVDETGWVLMRGVLDTVPRPWPDGTTVWFISFDSDFVLRSPVYADGETVRFKISTMTSRGELPLADAPIIAATLTARPHLPTRPANVTVGGIAFGSIDLSGSLPSTVAVTWANRNRTMEDGQVLTWTEGNVVPEAGQTTTIKVYATNGALISATTGLTGTSYNLPVAAFGTANVGDVRVYAARDGLESLQGHTIRVKVRPQGWGDNWGVDWGGADSGSPGNPEPEPPDPDPDPGDDFPDLPPWHHQHPV